MPNHSSHADHIPERSCVICKKKIDRSHLLRFVILQDKVVFDCKKYFPGRGFYICRENDKNCMEYLERWLNKRNRKRKKSNQIIQ